MSAEDIVRALSRPQVKAALDASLQAGSMDEFYGVVGMFRKSRSYFIQYGHRLHSLKAVVTFAAKQLDPDIQSNAFQSAVGARRLQELRFEVVHNVNDEDAKRERQWVKVLKRRQQIKFRERLVDLYGQCALTGCSTLAALEAAHVLPFGDDGPDTKENGILLRADLHKLFDADLLTINPKDGSVCISASCEADYKECLKGRIFEAPKGGPRLAAFQKRWGRFNATKNLS